MPTAPAEKALNIAGAKVYREASARSSMKDARDLLKQWQEHPETIDRQKLAEMASDPRMARLMLDAGMSMPRDFSKIKLPASLKYYKPGNREFEVYPSEVEPPAGPIKYGTSGKEPGRAVYPQQAAKEAGTAARMAASRGPVIPSGMETVKVPRRVKMKEYDPETYSSGGFTGKRVYQRVKGGKRAKVEEEHYEQRPVGGLEEFAGVDPATGKPFRDIEKYIPPPGTEIPYAGIPKAEPKSLGAVRKAEPGTHKGAREAEMKRPMATPTYMRGAKEPPRTRGTYTAKTSQESEMVRSLLDKVAELERLEAWEAKLGFKLKTADDLRSSIGSLESKLSGSSGSSGGELIARPTPPPSSKAKITTRSEAKPYTVTPPDFSKMYPSDIRKWGEDQVEVINKRGMEERRSDKRR
jgi:hypothetical protein